MRRANAVISALILILFLIHMIAGSLQLMGLIPGGSALMKTLARIMIALILVHMGIGIRLTVDTLRIQKRSGAVYLRENRLFWARRISGFALTLFIFFHLLLFMGQDAGGTYRLAPFEQLQLAAHILLVLALLVHILTNIRPLLISFGAARGRGCLKDILFVLSIALFFAAAAFIVYYLRWNVLWKLGG